MRLLAGRWSPRWLQICFYAAASSAIAAQDVGFKGPALAGSGPTVGFPTVTEAKPESKVWFNDGQWFGSLWSSNALAFRIHRLDPNTHAWIDTGVEVESRPDSHSDALAVGDKLYIATHELAEGVGGPGDPLLVLRYSYNTVGDAYTLDAGFPVTIGDWSTETMVIDRDSTGTLWAVWKQQSRVFFSHTLGSDTSWSAPAILPACTSDFTSDDICSVIRFGGNRIGVMWSDQTLNGYFFSTHVDGQPDTTWSPVEAALAGESDDHLDLAADSTGRVFAVVKNRADVIKLLVRTAGVWQQYLVAEAAEKLNRAIVQLNEEDQTVHIFGTIVDSIVEKVSPLSAIAFLAGARNTVIHDGSGLVVHNVTSTKQNFDGSTGLILLASNVTATGNYWHHEIPPAPVAGLVLEPPAPGKAGVINAFVARGATRGKPVVFYASLQPGSAVLRPPQCPGGIELDLASPLRRLGVVRANAQGVATLRMLVPSALAGRTFYFQAIEPFSCASSNVVQDQL